MGKPEARPHPEHMSYDEALAEYQVLREFSNIVDLSDDERNRAQRLQQRLSC